MPLFPVMIENMEMNFRKFLPQILIVSSVLLLFLCVGALTLTLQSVTLFKALKFEAAAHKAQQALIVVRPLSLLTFRLIPDVELWREALTLTSKSKEIAGTFAPLSTDTSDTTDPLTAFPLKPLTVKLTEVSHRLSKMEEQCQRSLIAKLIIDCQEIATAEQLANDGSTVGRWLTEEDPTLIVLFQNTEELRATGGFMGSYAKVQFTDGNISQLLIEDIYEPDGQFTGYVEPPAGVKEYLSSGKGMRLPDANWQVDFPSSAQTILNYFALGNEQSIDGVVAVNSDLVEKLLTVTGDVYLPDYSMTVTSANFTALARADRDQFFPGSQQKTNFLGHFFNVLKFKLTQLNQEQQLQLAMILRESLKDKTIQLYSGNTNVQKIFTDYHTAGALESPDQTSPFIYLVESNVGINKANKSVTRTVHLNVRSTHLTVSVNFNNQNSDLGYVNYQRVIVPTDWSLGVDDLVTPLWIDGHSGTYLNEEIITNNQGQQFKQIGFLVTIPPQSSVNTQITFTHSLWAPGNTSLAILKQPGLPPTPYTVTIEDKVESLVIDQNTLIKMPN